MEENNEMYISDLLAKIIGTKSEYMNSELSEYIFRASFHDESNTIVYQKRAEVLLKKYIDDIACFLNDRCDDVVKSRVIKNYTLDSLKVFIDTMYGSKNFRFILQDMFNIRINLVKSFGYECGYYNVISNMTKKLTEAKMNNTSFIIESDGEYHYLIGQLVLFIESISSERLNLERCRTYCDKKDDKNLKVCLAQKIEAVYGYVKNHVFFDLLIQMISDYQPSTSIYDNRLYFYLGFSVDNIFYSSKSDLGNGDIDKNE